MTKVNRSMGLVCILLALVLAGCGGGSSDGGSSQATTAVNGIWQISGMEGSLAFTGGALLYNGRILAITESSSMTGLYDGNYTVSGNTLSGSVRIYQEGYGLIGNGLINGTVSATTMHLNFTTNYGTSGTMTLDYDDIYERNSSLALVVGTWADFFGDTLTVNPDGSYLYYTDGVCIDSGRVSIINSSRNLYQITGTVAGCGFADGNYSGYGFLFDIDATNDGFLYAITSDNYLFINYGQRQ